MYLWILSLSCLIAVSIGQKSDGPAISTANGNLRLKSRGDMIFEVGDSGQVQFMTANGDAMQFGMKGDKGDKGDMGDTRDQGAVGPQGPVGPRGPVGSQGPRGFSTSGGTVIAWNECAWRNLNSGLDYGLIVECQFTKKNNDTWLRLTWNGNMRIFRCTNCCMRWFFTINGEECADPGPLDVVMFQTQNVHILRQSTIVGSCRATGPLTDSTPLDAGPKRIQFSIQDCPGFGGFVYDAYTGFNSVSRIIIEEIIPRDESVPEVAVTPPAGYIFSPHYCQFLYPNLGINTERNLGPIVVTKFQKYHDHTVLKITWEGNFRKKNCRLCCSRWWINIDGSQCSNYESIETSITSSTPVDIFVPTTLTGVCFESGDLPISTGAHQITLMVGNCPGSPFTNAASGLFSTSRLIVEEIPRPRDSLVNSNAYHPQWSHCAINEIANGGLDEGALEDTACLLNKSSSDSAVKVSFNGNIRITNCEDCCMRWYITLNGSECVSPAPIEAVIYSTNARSISVHRGSTIAGICRETSLGVIPSGPVQAQLNVGMCDGYNETFDAYTGLESVSTINIEEMPTPLPSAPSDGSYYPNWLQCVTDTPLNSTVNDSTVMTCDFTKQRVNSTLRVAWDGNIAVVGCDNCCMRWFITINGQECSDPGPIDIAIRQDLTDLNENIRFDDYRPASVVGYCTGNEAGGFSAGSYTIGLSVGACSNSDNEEITTSEVMTGYNSVSRFIIEEVPNQNQNECTQGR